MSYRGRGPLTGMSVQPGTQLSGIYHIDSFIAAGGMAEVYLGHNIQTGDPVAIKIVLREFAEDEMILELLKKEARILFQLAHEAIVRYYVFTIDPVLSCAYLAMEYVDGPSLAQRLQSGPLSLEEAVILKTRLADGLATAHAAGVIHRDVSPDNIILPGNKVERAKIIDFSIARTTKIGSGTILAGSFAGKYNFVSPEQLGMFGGHVTAVSDVYSLGLVLATALRGTPLDMAGSQADVIEKRRHVPGLEGIDPRLHDLLRAMLTPDPAKRLATMAQVRDWPVEITRPEPRPLQAAAKTGERAIPARPLAKPASARPAPAESRNLALWSSLGILALVVALVIGGWYYVETATEETTGTGTADPAAAARNQAFIRDYQEGACFLAAPLAVSDKAAEVAVYAPSEEAVKKFAAAFTAAAGFAPRTTLFPVTEKQCVVVNAAQTLSRGTRPPPAVSLDKQVLGLQEDPSGHVRSAPQGSVYLLLVDHAGFISNATSKLKGTGGEHDFSVPLTLPTDPGTLAKLLNQPQLAVAVSSGQPLPMLQDLKFGKAPELIPMLMNQKDISMALGYFKFIGNSQ